MTENPQILFTHFLVFFSSNALGNFSLTQNMSHLEAQKRPDSVGV